MGDAGDDGTTSLHPPGVFAVLIVVLFTVCGGAIGGAALWLAMLASAVAAEGAGVLFESGSVFGAFGAMLIMGGFAGAPYALATGVVYALLPKRLQRIVVAPLIGGVATLGLAFLGVAPLALTEPGALEPRALAALGALGAIAAAACAALARCWSLDARGRSRQGGMRPGGSP